MTIPSEELNFDSECVTSDRSYHTANRLTLPEVNPELSRYSPLPSTFFEESLSGDAESGGWLAGSYIFASSKQRIFDYVDAQMIKHNKFAWSIQFQEYECTIQWYKGQPPQSFATDLPPKTRHTWYLDGTKCILRSN